MKKYFFLFVILAWGTLFYFAYEAGITKGDFQSIEKVITIYDGYSELFFFLLFVFRILFLIPSTVFMVVGGFLFSPVKAVVMGITAIIVTESIVYLVGKFAKNRPIYQQVVKKYPKIFRYINHYRLPYFTLTLLCPIIPMDAACFAVSTTKMKYLSYVIGIVIGNLPLHILYSVFGSYLTSSPILVAVIGIAILIIGGLGIFLWNKLTNKFEQEEKVHEKQHGSSV